MLILLLGILYSILWRCRGSDAFPGGNWVGRILFWSVPCAIWGYCTIGYPGLLCGPLAFIGLLLSYAPFMGDSEPKHGAGMAGIGIARMLILLAPVLYLHPELFWVAYLNSLIGLAYVLCWEYLDGTYCGFTFPSLTIRGHSLITPLPFATGGAEWGEVFTGFIQGALMAYITITIKGFSWLI